jgi:phosphate transport system protein
MQIHLQKEVEKLKKHILTLSAKVEYSVRMAVHAADLRDEKLAQEVISQEQDTNTSEVEIEEECLKILALYQPVAGDLRYIVAVLKIDHDLERIGDLAVHIAERAITISKQPQINIPFKLEEMGEKTQKLLKDVLDAFIKLDANLARKVCAEDSEVDKMNKEIFQYVKNTVQQSPHLFEPLLQIMHIARHLERIGDHATNIAEDLIYLIEGKIVRHNSELANENSAT